MADLSGNVDTAELDEDDLPDILDEIGELSGRYENIATCLRVKANAVDRIKSERLNSDAALKEVVREWLKNNYNFERFGPPSWKTLAEAVAKPAGDNDRALAEKIANGHQAGGIPETPREIPEEIMTHSMETSANSQFREPVILPKEPNWFDESEGEKVQSDGGKQPFERFQPLESPYESVSLSFGKVEVITDILKTKQIKAYSMSRFPHGIALIINNEKFKKKGERKGTNIDERNLVKVFQYLGYLVEVHRDCTSEKIPDIMKKMRQRDHSKYDSFICCILSHGKEGYVYGADDKEVSLDDISTNFSGKECPGLTDKPKLFFLQACRGVLRDKGVKVDGDIEEEENIGNQVVADGGNKIPDAADFSFGYATPPGHVAWRDKDNGSWYVSELCRCLVGYSKYLSLDKIMTITNENVSSDYITGKNKQCAEFVSRLRKDVFFF